MSADEGEPVDTQPAYTEADVNDAIVALFESHEAGLRFGPEARAVLDAVVPAIAARAKADALREVTDEWAVAHAQGLYTGSYGHPLTEAQARQWASENAARDPRRRSEARGRTRLMRRRVTEWQVVPSATDEIEAGK